MTPRIPDPHRDRLIRLPHRLAIYVPSLTQTGKSIPDRSGLVSDVQRRLTSLCGGTTSTETQGTFVTENGDIMAESVTVVVGNCASYVNIWDDFWDLAESVRLKARQESVAVSVDASLYLLQDSHREDTESTPFGGTLATDPDFWT